MGENWEEVKYEFIAFQNRLAANYNQFAKKNYLQFHTIYVMIIKDFNLA